MKKTIFKDVVPRSLAIHGERVSALISNDKACTAWLRTDPTERDVKLAVLAEINRPRGHRMQIINHLVVALMRFERKRLESKIMNHLKP